MAITLRGSLNRVSTDVVLMGVYGAVGALATRVFTHLNPLYGGAISAASILISRLAEPILEPALKLVFFGLGANKASCLLGYSIIRLAGVACATAGAIMLNVPVTLPTTLVLTASMVAVQVLGVFDKF